MDRPRVLLVDDNKGFTEMVERWLSPHYEVLVAHDGAEAYRRAEEARPDCLLVDIMMPGVSGLDLLEAVGRRAHLVDVPVIVMSGYADMSDPEVVNALHPWVALQKPITAEQLLESLRIAMATPHVEGEPSAERGARRDALIERLRHKRHDPP